MVRTKTRIVYVSIDALYYIICFAMNRKDRLTIIVGTTNGFNSIATKVQADLQIKDEELAVLSGLGVLGLYFVIPAG